MKNSICTLIFMVTLTGCSHYNPVASENIKNNLDRSSSFTQRTPANEDTCLKTLSGFLQTNEGLLDSSSAKQWDDLSSSIMDQFNKKLQEVSPYTNRPIYEKSMPHVQTLERIFKIKSTEKSTTSVGEIISIYQKYMKDLVSRNLIKKEDVLLPAFVFRTVEGKIIWKQFGEEIPTGSVLEGNVLTPEVFNGMVKEGFFPMGNADLTTTGISAFEHDLAHLTGFIEDPNYMKALKKLAKIDQSRLTDNQSKRAYFFNEGLVKIKNGIELMRNLKLSDEMRKNPSKVTYDEMLNYLKGFSTEELEKTRMELVKNSHKYYSMLGGAGRDPISRNNNVFHDMIKAAIPKISMEIEKDNDYLIVTSYEGLASVQLILLRLRDIKYDDWVDSITHTVEKKSPVYKLFEDKRIWQDTEGVLPGLGEQFEEMRMYFLKDEQGMLF